VLDFSFRDRFALSPIECSDASRLLLDVFFYACIYRDVLRSCRPARVKQHRINNHTRIKSQASKTDLKIRSISGGIPKAFLKALRIERLGRVFFVPYLGYHCPAAFPKRSPKLVYVSMTRWVRHFPSRFSLCPASSERSLWSA
jgi:hypothetical protein